MKYGYNTYQNIKSLTKYNYTNNLKSEVKYNIKVIIIITSIKIFLHVLYHRITGFCYLTNLKLNRGDYRGIHRELQRTTC